jgi:hypothetical protein
MIVSHTRESFQFFKNVSILHILVNLSLKINREVKTTSREMRNFLHSLPVWIILHRGDGDLKSLNKKHKAVMK